jgi:hypothetical protein
MISIPLPRSLSFHRMVRLDSPPGGRVEATRFFCVAQPPNLAVEGGRGAGFAIFTQFYPGFWVVLLRLLRCWTSKNLDLPDLPTFMCAGCEANV